jgi:hypothetical protein
MKTLQQRLFHLFKPADIALARKLSHVSATCPRVGQVRATVTDDDGTEQEVSLELSAHRRGGMTLEAHCTSAAGRVGRPCAVLAAVLLEVDRRGLLSGIHDQTPVALEIVADDTADMEFDVETEADAPDEDEPQPAARAPRQLSVGRHEPRLRTEPARRGGQRLPAWAV